MLSVVMLNVVMLNVVMLNVAMLIVVGPFYKEDAEYRINYQPVCFKETE